MLSSATAKPDVAARFVPGMAPSIDFETPVVAPLSLSSALAGMPLLGRAARSAASRVMIAIPVGLALGSAEGSSRGKRHDPDGQNGKSLDDLPSL